MLWPWHYLFWHVQILGSRYSKMIPLFPKPNLTQIQQSLIRNIQMNISWTVDGWYWILPQSIFQYFSIPFPCVSVKRIHNVNFVILKIFLNWFNISRWSRCLISSGFEFCTDLITNHIQYLLQTSMSFKVSPLFSFSWSLILPFTLAVK